MLAARRCAAQQRRYRRDRKLECQLVKDVRLKRTDELLHLLCVDCAALLIRVPDVGGASFLTRSACSSAWSSALEGRRVPPIRVSCQVPGRVELASRGDFLFLLRETGFVFGMFCAMPMEPWASPTAASGLCRDCLGGV